MDDLISRQEAIDGILQFMPSNLRDDATAEEQINYAVWRCALGCAISVVGTQPIAEPQQWHVLTRRPMDEDERKEWSERLGYDIEYDDAYIYSNLPDDEEEVIICTHNGHVCTDIYYNDDDSYFDNHELDEVVAWMPLPEPWKGGANE